MSFTLTRAHIADELYRTIGLSHNESAELVETFFEEILLCFEKVVEKNRLNYLKTLLNNNIDSFLN